MRQFHVRVGLGTMLDEVDLLFGGIIFTTALASLQGLHADNRLIDFDGAQLTLINHLDIWVICFIRHCVFLADKTLGTVAIGVGGNIDRLLHLFE